MRTPLALLFLAALTGAAAAQSQPYEGNWECRAGEANAGLLTIYGASYIYASAAANDPASGGGDIVGYTDGVGFESGPLVDALGLRAGRLIEGGGRQLMQLETDADVVMVCGAR